MTLEQKPPKKLVIWTLFLLLCATVIVPILYNERLPEAVELNVQGQPTIGYPKAPVHMVIFEEPKCVECRQFSVQTLPLIKKNYIDTNKIRCTIVPVSFIPSSLSAAIALLSVYYSDPQFPNDELFFKYIDYMYEHQPSENTNWATPEMMVKMAKGASPAINTDQIKENILHEKYRIRIEKNTKYATEVMDGKLMTPTVYVNGIKADDLSYSALSKLINEVLQRNGG